MDETFNYNQLLLMLRSNDIENHVTALSCIDNMPFEKNFVKMIYLKKEANVTYEYWSANAPSSAKYLKSLFGTSNLRITEPFSHMDVRSIITNTVCTEEELKFFLMKSFQGHIDFLMIGETYPIIKNMELKVDNDG